MKKTILMALALATCLGYAPARAAEVVSSNIVGYSKLTMPADGYALIANPFVEVGTGDNIAINDMFAEDTTAANAGSSVTTSDNIEVWNGVGYTTYYLYSKNGSVPYWMKLGDRKATTDAIPEGEAAFYHNCAETVTLTISGEVKADSETLTIIPGYNLVKNPYPTALDFDNFVVDGATSGSSVTTADNIEIWNGAGYTTYYLYSKNGSAPYWMKLGDRKKTTDTIAPYTGFFYHAIGENTFSVTIESPLAGE